MAKEEKEAIEKRPSAEIQTGSSFLISLFTVLLILVGAADIGLWGYCGLAAYGNKKEPRVIRDTAAS